MDLLRSMAASMADEISDLRKDLRTATAQVHQIISADYESRITSVEAKLREYISPLLSRRRTVQNLLAVLTCPVCHDMPTFSNIMISCCCGSMCCLPCLMTWSPSSNDVDNENDDERLRCPCCRATSPKQSFHCLPRWAGAWNRVWKIYQIRITVNKLCCIAPFNNASFLCVFSAFFNELVRCVVVSRM